MVSPKHLFPLHLLLTGFYLPVLSVYIINCLYSTIFPPSIRIMKSIIS